MSFNVFREDGCWRKNIPTEMKILKIRISHFVKPWPTKSNAIWIGNKISRFSCGSIKYAEVWRLQRIRKIYVQNSINNQLDAMITMY